MIVIDVPALPGLAPVVLLNEHPSLVGRALRDVQAAAGSHLVRTRHVGSASATSTGRTPSSPGACTADRSTSGPPEPVPAHPPSGGPTPA
jgi:hypothetical protein